MFASHKRRYEILNPIEISFNLTAAIYAAFRIYTTDTSKKLKFMHKVPLASATIRIRREHFCLLTDICPVFASIATTLQEQFLCTIESQIFVDPDECKLYQKVFRHFGGLITKLINVSFERFTLEGTKISNVIK